MAEPVQTTPTAQRTLEHAAGVQFVGEQLTLPLDICNMPEVPAYLMRTRRAPGPSEIAHMVSMFHKSFRLPRQALPTLDTIDRDMLALRTALLDEETTEFADAAAQRDLVAMADALADVVYVAFGSAITLGIDLDAVLREVHRSNMSKLDDQGRPILRDDGKVLKSPRYTRPDIHTVLDGQLPLPL